MQDKAAGAQAAVRADLAALHRRRSFGFLGVALAGAAFTTWLVIAPPPIMAAPRDGLWILSLVLLYVSLLLGTSAALGVPLWERGALAVLTAVSLLTAVAGTLLVIQPASPAVGFQVKCLLHGTVVALVCFAALRLTTARLWRRFPSPAAVASVGATAVGLSFLCARCGVADPVHVVASHLPVLVSVFALTRFWAAWRKASGETSP